MTYFEVILLLVLLGIGAHAAVRSMRRKRRRELRGRQAKEAQQAIPAIMAGELDPAFAVGPLGPDRERAEVVFVGGGAVLVPGSTSDFEAWLLAVLAKNARRMFEFGTCTGRTTYLWARNSPPDAIITTITLAAEHLDLYAADAADSPEDAAQARAESTFDEFLYSGTDVAHKVEQLFGDSKAFDESPHAGTMDLIFVDGSHAYSYVLSDSRKALRMIKPGGLILWHDYEGPGAGRGTDVALVELGRELPLRVIHGTRMVAYRAPRAPGE
jgi:predicted O-methyltransferase YrrM